MPATGDITEHGPLIQVTIRVKTDTGEEVERQIQALLDTGARFNVISTQFETEMRIQKYQAQIGNPPPKEACCFTVSHPSLANYHSVAWIRAMDTDQPPLILNRDFLSLYRFSYNDPPGKWSLKEPPIDEE